MTVVLKIGRHVKDVEHAHEYEIEVKFMHGDADGYTVDWYFFDAHFEAEMKRLNCSLAGLSVMASEDFYELRNSKESERSAIAECFEKLGYGEDDVDEFCDNFFNHDISDSGYNYRAAVDEVAVFYYDPDGSKRSVGVKVNGKKL